METYGVQMYLADCRCTVGAQECPQHPGHLLTTLERILFEKAWDRRVRQAQA